MKFIQNKTDDIIIGLNKEELSTSLTLMFLVKFITIGKESTHKKDKEEFQIQYTLTYFSVERIDLPRALLIT